MMQRTLTPGSASHMEIILKREIRECNEAIRACNAKGDKKSAKYIREVRREPLIRELADVRRGYIFE